LLEIEWHTAESWWEEVREPLLKLHQEMDEENMQSEGFMALSDEEREYYIEQHEIFYKELREYYEKELDRVRNGEYFVARYINGAERENSEGISGSAEWLQYFTDPDGYFMHYLYPWTLDIFYLDENGQSQFKQFGRVNSKEAFDRMITNQVIPYIHSLLERGGAIMPEEYDRVMTDPLDRYVNMWF
jgi:hypothetical protein